MIDPADADALHALALAFLAQGDRVAALGAARRAVAAHPGHLDAQLTFGRLCRRVGYAARAIAAFEAACRVAPHRADLARELASAALREQPQVALAAARRAVALEPDAAASAVALGDALLAVDDLAAADRSYLQALAIDATCALAICGRGFVHLAAARWHDAWRAFDDALALAPDCHEARYERALLDLRFERYARGFADYAAIMRVPAQQPRYHYAEAGVPLWGGEPLGMRRLVIAYEQGIGNQLMMARFFDQLPRYGDQIAIETPPTLLTLVQRSFPALTFVPFERWQSIDAMDVHLPFMQLPGVLGIADAAQLAPRMPYLAVDPTRVAAMRARVTLAPALRNIGIVWHGNRANDRERWRAAPLAAWAPLATISSVRFHSLQVDASREELAGAPLAIAPTHERIRDMDDTAALVSLLDAVITVDTSVVHLAGALARPTLLLEPWRSDYRWGVDRTDTPWYPTVRIIRQPARDAWLPVFSEIAATLAPRRA